MHDAPDAAVTAKPTTRASRAARSEVQRVDARPAFFLESKEQAHHLD
jgi:hypothetical protein